MAVDTETIATALGQAVPASGSATEAQWEMWIADAQMLIDSRAALLEIEEIDTAKYDYVVREAVVAQVKRPDDATEVRIDVDDGSTSKTYRSSAGRVTILDEWWALLGLTEMSGAFSLNMAATAALHLAWCSASLGANYCSCGVDIAGFPLFEGGSDW